MIDFYSPVILQHLMETNMGSVIFYSCPVSRQTNAPNAKLSNCSSIIQWYKPGVEGSEFGSTFPLLHVNCITGSPFPFGTIYNIIRHKFHLLLDK